MSITPEPPLKTREGRLKHGSILNGNIGLRRVSSQWKSTLDNTITYYHSKGVKKVFVIGRKDQGLSGQSLLRKFGSLKGIEEKSGKFRSDEAVNINAMLKSQLGPGVYVDIMDLVCPKRGQCRVATPDGKIIFSDIMHYTRPGTDFMASVYASNGIFGVLENPNQAKAGD